MIERAKELISTFVDDNLSNDEATELCALWDQYPQLADIFAGYIAVGQLLRDEPSLAPLRAAELLLGLRERIATGAAGEIAGSNATSQANALSESMMPEQLFGRCSSDTESSSVIAADFSRPSRPWRKVAASLALAASVAAVAVGSLRLLNTAPDAVEGAPTLAASAVPANQVAATQPVAATVPIRTVSSAQPELRWNVQQPAVERRLNTYLLQHNEVLRNGMRGMLPYARIVGYKPSEQ